MSSAKDCTTVVLGSFHCIYISKKFLSVFLLVKYWNFEICSCGDNADNCGKSGIGFDDDDDDDDNDKICGNSELSAISKILKRIKSESRAGMVTRHTR